MRLDVLLVEKGLVTSRTQAQKMIREGQVEVARGSTWQALLKASEQVEPDCGIRVNKNADDRYVSRAGLKLAGALRHMDIAVQNIHALDVGQSTGGFSDCLLQAGAAKVIGVDVGRGQLAKTLLGHPRLVSIEGINARHLRREDLYDHIGETSFDMVVMDVSFISQSLILPRLVGLMKPRAWLLSLVKPQFELEPSAISKGGLVRGEHHFQAVREKIMASAENLGLDVKDYFESCITGGDGNREYFIAAQR